jgi:hypothetical protein
LPIASLASTQHTHGGAPRACIVAGGAAHTPSHLAPPARRCPHSNFCAKAGLLRTAEAFEAEWYELKATGRLGGLATSMPDVYLRNGVRGLRTHRYCAAGGRAGGAAPRLRTRTGGRAQQRGRDRARRARGV